MTVEARMEQAEQKQSGRAMEDTARQSSGRSRQSAGLWEAGPPGAAIVGKGATKQEAAADREDQLREKKKKAGIDALKQGEAFGDLSDCALTSDEGAEIAEALKASKSTVVDLSGNILADDGLRAIAEVLPQNTSITALNLRSNSIGESNAVGAQDNDDAVEQLASALASNSSIEHVDLCWNTIWADGKEALAEQVSASRSIAVDDGLPNPSGGKPWEFNFVESSKAERRH